VSQVLICLMDSLCLPIIFMSSAVDTEQCTRVLGAAPYNRAFSEKGRDAIQTVSITYTHFVYYHREVK
jgi:hypothetical protein